MIAARILIVEDEPILAADVAQSLSSMGHTIIGIAAAGPDALRLAAGEKPDIILMDINIRGPFDGIETAVLLKESGLHIPVIFLTSYMDSETVTRARVVEPFGYLLKPFDEALIGVTIELSLHRHQMEVERERMRRELEESQAEVNILSGLLPICSHCKKIRNDTGYWEKIESYIARHTAAQFSHSICADCLPTHDLDAAEKANAKASASPVLAASAQS